MSLPARRSAAARSCAALLGDVLTRASRDAIRDEMNDKIKKRELFRPFAPSATAEAAPAFFDLGQDSPYMNIVARVRDDLLAALSHLPDAGSVAAVVRELATVG